MSGKFSPQQREVYEALLSVQVELISLLSGHPSLDALFSSMCQLLAIRLKEVGLISSKVTSKQELAQVSDALLYHSQYTDLVTILVLIICFFLLFRQLIHFAPIMSATIWAWTSMTLN